MFFGLSFDVVLGLESAYIFYLLQRTCRTPIGLAAVRMASESSLKVSDMIGIGHERLWVLRPV